MDSIESADAPSAPECVAARHSQSGHFRFVRDGEVECLRVQQVIVGVAAVEKGGLKEAVLGVGFPVIEHEEPGLQAFKLDGTHERRRRRGIHVGPAEVFRLVAREKIRLRTGPAQLHATAEAVEIVFAVLDGAVTLGPCRLRLDPPGPAVHSPDMAGLRRASALEIEIVVPRARRDLPAGHNRRPPVGDGPDGAVETA